MSPKPLYASLAATAKNLGVATHLQLPGPGLRNRARGSEWLWVKALAICVLLFLSATAYALDPTKSVYQFNCQNWTHQNGLPSDGINAIRQTPDGYIWLGTHKGLVRFDGSEFKVFSSSLPGQPSPEIRTLAPSKDRVRNLVWRQRWQLRLF